MNSLMNYLQINKTKRVLYIAGLFTLFLVIGKIAAMDMNSKVDSKSKMYEDQEIMVSSGDDHKIKIWDISKIKSAKNSELLNKLVELKPLAEISAKEFKELSSQLYNFSANALMFGQFYRSAKNPRNVLISGSKSGLVSEWDLSESSRPKFISNLKANGNDSNSCTSISFSKFDKKILALGLGSKVEFFDLSSKKMLSDIKFGSDQFSNSCIALFDPFYKNRLIVGYTYSRPQVNQENTCIVEVFDLSNFSQPKNTMKEIVFKNNYIKSLEFSNFKKNLFTVTLSNAVYFCLLQDNQNPKIMAAIERSAIKSSAFSPLDGNRFILTSIPGRSGGGRVEIFDISNIFEKQESKSLVKMKDKSFSNKQKPKRLMKIEDPDSIFHSVAFSLYDENIIFLGLHNGEIQAIDISEIAKPKIITNLLGHGFVPVKAMAFLPKIKKMTEEKKFKKKLLEATGPGVKKQVAPDVRVLRFKD